MDNGKLPIKTSEGNFGLFLAQDELRCVEQSEVCEEEDEKCQVWGEPRSFIPGG